MVEYLRTMAVEAPGTAPLDRVEALKVREVIALLEADGWRLVTTRGDHRQYKHPVKPGRVTIPGHLNDDLAPKTRDSVFKQAGIPKSGRK